MGYSNRRHESSLKLIHRVPWCKWVSASLGCLVVGMVRCVVWRWGAGEREGDLAGCCGWVVGPGDRAVAGP